MKENLIIFLGKINGSGKISFKFLKKLLKFEFNNFDTFHVKELSEFERVIEAYHMRYKKVVVFPIYREAHQAYLKKISKGRFCEGIGMAKEASELCKKYKNFVIFHNAEMGEIIGDKIKTNTFLSNNGIKCPLMIKDKSYQGKVFKNEISDSNTETEVLNGGSLISDKFYNTEFIDTTFEYNGKKYYAAPRVMAVGKEIIEIQIRLRDCSENNPNVHAKGAPTDPMLLNAYYENVVLPKIDKIKQICEKIYQIAGFGFYNHDFLLCSKTQEVYVTETGYKFDNDFWKEITNNVVGSLKSEINLEDTHLKILNTFERELISSI